MFITTLIIFIFIVTIFIFTMQLWMLVTKIHDLLILIVAGTDRQLHDQYGYLPKMVGYYLLDLSCIISLNTNTHELRSIKEVI